MVQEEVEFTVTCKMKKRWVNQFLSFLEYLEHNGIIGHSCRVGFYADGDGDFRPRFKTDIEWQQETAPIDISSDKEKEKLCGHSYNEVTFDAG